ncbi:MAG: MTH1187 family thiamine-binding protein [Dehalococcoidales bacterium]|nr:MTH1187 family thiamine-binding protein [Dehalococcoidales bacterium]
MAMMEISVLPVGTGSPSVSRFVARALEVLGDAKYELTPMGTVVEGDLEDLLRLARRMHLAVFDAGAVRVVTTIRIDDRRDKPLTIEGKIRAVKEKLGV